MADWQEHLKNLLLSGHQFDAALKRALDLVREDKDWDELNQVISKREEEIAKAKVEVQKRHPSLRNGGSARGSACVKSGGSSVTSQRVAAAVPVGGGMGGAGDAAITLTGHLSLNGLSPSITDARTTAKERARMNKSPTKFNHRAKNQFFDDGPDKRATQDPFGIFLPNVPSTTTDDHLRSRFSHSGLVREAKVIYKGPQGPRHGIIRFEKRETAQQWVGTNVVVDGKEVTVAPLHDKSKSKSETRVTSGQHNKNSTETLIETSITRKIAQQNPPAGPRPGYTPHVHVAEPVPFRSSGDRCRMCKETKVNCALSCGHRAVCSVCAAKLSVCPESGCGLKVTAIARD